MGLMLPGIIRKVFLMNCPVCNGREIGKIGTSQYFCWNCLVEFNDQEQVFEISEDGSLVNLNDEEF